MDASGWREPFFDARLEEAYRRTCEAHQDLFSLSIRARISSLLLRPELARSHFEHALDFAKGAAPSKKAIVRILLLIAYAVEHELLFEGPSERLSAVAQHGLGSVTSGDREVDRAKRQVQGAHARVLLGLRRNVEALQSYAQLIRVERSQDKTPDTLATWHQGKACAVAAIGDEDPDEDLEAAGQYCLTCDHRLHQARISSLLASSWAYLGDAARAHTWSRFLTNLRCNPETERSLRLRGLLMISRSVEARQLVSL